MTPIGGFSVVPLGNFLEVGWTWWLWSACLHACTSSLLFNFDTGQKKMEYERRDPPPPPLATEAQGVTRNSHNPNEVSCVTPIEEHNSQIYPYTIDMHASVSLLSNTFRDSNTPPTRFKHVSNLQCVGNNNNFEMAYTQQPLCCQVVEGSRNSTNFLQSALLKRHSTTGKAVSTVGLSFTCRNNDCGEGWIRMMWKRGKTNLFRVTLIW